MINIEYSDNVIYFKNICRNDLQILLKWYNQTKNFKFATGFDKAITERELFRKYREVLICRSEFFTGIYKKETDELIGVIKGGINNRQKDSVWINSIMINVPFQNRGFGTRAVTLMINYLKSNFYIEKAYISVVDSNIGAKRFWNRLGFIELRKMNNHLILDNQKQNIIIMQKNVNI
jgi:RimJ/RimL family protein N-acetyltransferase